MQNLKIALVQLDLFWENRVANLAHIEEQLWTLEKGVDLVVLPEMFSTGFSMDPEKLAETMQLHTHRWMLQQARQHKVVLTGSVIIKEKGVYYNRLLWVTPEGVTSYYDKRHLFRMAKEDQKYAPGRNKLIVELKGWKICPLICYDLRFPVWSRNTFVNDGLDFDALLYVANWPQARITAWDALLKARAIENLCYVAGVNRVGEDGNQIQYNGHTQLVNFKGETTLAENKETLFYTELLGSELMAYREKFPAYKDADNFKIDN